MTVVTVSDFTEWSCGSTGTWTEAKITLALGVAEGIVETFLGTYLTPTSVTEEHPWPYDRPLQLQKRQVTAISSVTAMHYLECDCDWVTTDECAVIFDGTQGIIKPLACSSFPCCTARGQWCGCECPARVSIIYVAGYTTTQMADEKTGGTIKLAVTLIAKWILEKLLVTYPEGSKMVTSWSSMDYSESIADTTWKAYVSSDPKVVAALDLLKFLKGYRFIGIRGSGRR